jgi:hypothetical protein
MLTGYGKLAMVIFCINQYLNISTPTAEMAKASISHQGLKVITNKLNITSTFKRL